MVNNLNSPTNNIEPAARAICEMELSRAPGAIVAEIPSLVDRYWPAVAAQLSAGLRGEGGELLPHSAESGIAAWHQWLDEHDSQPRNR